MRFEPQLQALGRQFFIIHQDGSDRHVRSVPIVICPSGWNGNSMTTVNPPSAPRWASNRCWSPKACASRSLMLAKPTPVDSVAPPVVGRSEEHTSELQSLMRTSYAVFCLKKINIHNQAI